MKNASVDLLRGPILRSLLIFALPIMVSNIFQQLYNTADVMIVGRFLGPDALAAVGASNMAIYTCVGNSVYYLFGYPIYWSVRYC